MFKSLKDSIRSLWSNTTDLIGQERNQSQRKRSNVDCVDKDCDGNDPDVQFVKVVKRRRLEEPSSTSTPGFTGLVKNSVTKMAYWVQPSQSNFSEDFRTTPVTQSNSRGHKAAQENGCHSNINHRPVPQTNGDHNDLYKDGAFGRGSRINGTEDVQRNISHRKQPGNASFMRRSSESSLFGSKQSTAVESVRLKEKEQYSKLLQMHTQQPFWQKKLPWFCSGRSASSSTVREDAKEQSARCRVPQAPLDPACERLVSAKQAAEIVKNSDISELIDRQRQRDSKVMPPPSSATPLVGSPTSISQSQAGYSQGRTFQSSIGTQPDSTVRSYPHSYLQRRSISSRRDLNVSKGVGNESSAPILIDNSVTDIKSKNILKNERIADAIVIDDEEEQSSAKRKPYSSQKCKAVDRFSLESKFSESCLKRSQAFTQERERRQLEIEKEQMNAKAYEEKRRIQAKSLEKQMKYQMKIFDDMPEVVEDPYVSSDEEEEVMPDLTDDMIDVVKRALRPGNPNEVLSEAFRLQITRRDMSTLGGLNWLNDEVINFYMNMLMERGEQQGWAKVYAFNTFFYPKIMSGGHQAVRRWTKKVDIFSVHFIIIPVHLGVHWCLCTVDMKDKKILYYDSMGARNDKCLQAVLNYINDESIAKKQTGINKSEWSLINVDDNPQQMNGSDCGMFMCKYAEYIAREKEITFSQEDMPYFRQRMIYEIISKKLLQ